MWCPDVYHTELNMPIGCIWAKLRYSVDIFSVPRVFSSSIQVPLLPHSDLSLGPHHWCSILHLLSQKCWWASAVPLEIDPPCGHHLIAVLSALLVLGAEWLPLLRPWQEGVAGVGPMNVELFAQGPVNCNMLPPLIPLHFQARQF